MNISQLVSSLLAIVKANFFLAALPAILAFLQAMEKAPPITSLALFQLYLAAQVATLNSSLAAALPTMAQSDVASLASALAAEVQAALAAAQNPAVTK